jgi:phosphoglycolate phosphatase
VKKEKTLLIFDLDGVLVDSKINMKNAWEKTQKKHNLKKNFKDYFKFIGLPFDVILEKLLIKQNQIDIAKTYQKESVKFLHKIKLYNGVFKTLKSLKRKKFRLAIVTSKDKIRTKKLVKKFNLDFDYVCSPMKNLKGKPHPDQLNYVIQKLNSNKKKTFYIGDMFVDYIASKKAKINFIFASYGYGKRNILFKKYIKNFKVLENIFK